MGATLLIIYAVVGCGSSLFVMIRRLRVGSAQGRSAAILVFFLWPFLLPALLVQTDSLPSFVSIEPGDGPRADRLVTLARSFQEIEAQFQREREVLRPFLEQICLTDRRLQEMEREMVLAPIRVRDRLDVMYRETCSEFEDNAGLLEEVVSELVVLRFADMSNPSRSQTERERVEDLLAQIEASFQLSTTAV